MHITRVFYRNRATKDTKVLSWTTILTNPVIYNGQPMDHASNQFVAYADLSLGDGDYSFQTVNARGVFLKRIVNGALADRDAADIAKDINNKPGLYQDCELAIANYLGTREKVTWVSVGVKHVFIYLKELQIAAGVADNQLSAAGQTSLATLNWLNATINVPIEALMVTRDTEIATLDTED